MSNRVEHQKQNQPAIEKRPFGADRENRVEHQKLNLGCSQVAAGLPPD